MGTFHSVCVKILRRFAEALVEVPYGQGIDGTESKPVQSQTCAGAS